MLGATEMLDVVAHADKLDLNSIVLGDFLGGSAAGAREPKSRAELARFPDSPRIEILSDTAATASHALICPVLRRRGQAIPTRDRWIAASAREHGAALSTRDVHYSHIDGLRCGQRLGDFLPWHLSRGPAPAPA